jgi:hypothetical protein
MGELTPIIEIDGRTIENHSGLKILEQLQQRFREMIQPLSEPLPF